MVKAKKWILAKLFEGAAKVEDFQLVEEELPPIQPGEFLCEAIYLTVQPSLRAMSGAALQVGDTPKLGQVAYVTESKNGEYPVGSRLYLHTGWRTHTLVTPAMLPGKDAPVVRGPPMWIPDIASLPLSYCIGVLGNEGATAYFGVTECLKPQTGETFFVNAGAGATGSIAGQIAKIKGCVVVGCAGSDEKCAFMKEELGFDHVINYKSQDLDEALKQAAPGGVDCYFDNVGGDMSTRVIIKHMRKGGRVACIGSISTYNAGGLLSKDFSQLPGGPYIFGAVVSRSLSIRGLMVADYWARFYEAAHQIRDWMLEGKLKWRETMTQGFENTPQCFVDMMSGRNIGKALVKVSSILDNVYP